MRTACSLLQQLPPVPQLPIDLPAEMLHGNVGAMFNQHMTRISQLQQQNAEILNKRHAFRLQMAQLQQRIASINVMQRSINETFAMARNPNVNSGTKATLQAFRQGPTQTLRTFSEISDNNFPASMTMTAATTAAVQTTSTPMAASTADSNAERATITGRTKRLHTSHHRNYISC